MSLRIKFSLEGAVSNKIVKVISEIKDNFSEKLNVKELADTISISEVAFQVGYESPSQFSREFSRMYETVQNFVSVTNSYQNYTTV